VIDARSGSASPSSSAAPKAPVTSKGSVAPGLSNGGGILGAAPFRHRRGSFSGTTATSAAGSASEVAAGLPASTGSTSATTAPTGGRRYDPAHGAGRPPHQQPAGQGPGQPHPDRQDGRHRHRRDGGGDGPAPGRHRQGPGQLERQGPRAGRAGGPARQPRAGP